MLDINAVICNVGMKVKSIMIHDLCESHIDIIHVTTTHVLSYDTSLVLLYPIFGT